MKVNFVVFSDDIPKDQKLCDINNAEIKFGTKKVATRKTIDVDEYFFIGLVLSGKVFWKYRMYDMNNRRRNVWLIRAEDYKQLEKWGKNDDQRLF